MMPLPAVGRVQNIHVVRCCCCCQVRRMFTALGHEVASLHRSSVGGLRLDGLPESEWRPLSAQEVDAVFNGPSADEVLGRDPHAT